jgi:hypothetical protein
MQKAKATICMTQKRTIMKIETRVYKVCRIEGPEHDAEHFGNYEEAEICAIQHSLDDGFWGVWDNLDRLEAIAYDGILYSQ